MNELQQWFEIDNSMQWWVAVWCYEFLPVLWGAYGGWMESTRGGAVTLPELACQYPEINGHYNISGHCTPWCDPLCITSVNQSGMKLYDIFDCALQIYSNLCRTVKWHVICYATKNSTTCSSVSNFQPKVVFHVFCCLLGLFTDVELCNDADESVKSHPHQSWTFSQVQVCLQQKENSVVCFISKYFV